MSSGIFGCTPDVNMMNVRKHPTMSFGLVNTSLFEGRKLKLIPSISPLCLEIIEKIVKPESQNIYLICKTCHPPKKLNNINAEELYDTNFKDRIMIQVRMNHGKPILSIVDKSAWSPLILPIGHVEVIPKSLFNIDYSSWKMLLLLVGYPKNQLLTNWTSSYLFDKNVIGCIGEFFGVPQQLSNGIYERVKYYFSKNSTTNIDYTSPSNKKRTAVPFETLRKKHHKNPDDFSCSFTICVEDNIKKEELKFKLSEEKRKKAEEQEKLEQEKMLKQTSCFFCSHCSLENVKVTSENFICLYCYHLYV
jgi:hypothetical protein